VEEVAMVALELVERVELVELVEVAAGTGRGRFDKSMTMKGRYYRTPS
jgi:hypothetical protein